MTESLLWALFLAIVQMESGGNLKAVNGDAVGPAQIKPVVVQDVTRLGHNVSLKDRTTLEGSYRIFKAYTDRWIAVKHLEDTPRNRANIWRHGPNAKVTLNGESTKYSLKVEKLAGIGFIETEGQKRQSNQVMHGNTGLVTVQ